MNRRVKLTQKTSNIKLTQTQPVIKLAKKVPKVVLRQVGREGKEGKVGPAGPGLPTGGLTGDIIVKKTNADYDYEFKSPNELADKNYVQNFTVSSVVTVNHNLNKFPNVTVIDSAGDEVVGEVYYAGVNEAIIRFAHPFSGTITCN